MWSASAAPTEVGADVTWEEVSPGVGNVVGIGRPIANNRAYVLDAQGALLPQGAVGELHIGGAGLALGYLRQPELSAARFIADPFNAEPDARLYRTGDLARWLPDGRLAYQGRQDHQIKLRGMRIEAGEVEAQLRLLPGVKDAVVNAYRKEEGDPVRLVAYLVCAAPAPAAQQELAAACRAALCLVLPDYMVPDLFVLVDSLPLTRTGKVDRNALPPPSAAQLRKSDYVGPRNEIEATLCSLWQSVLKAERIGIDDNFFSSGGDSITSMLLVARARQQGFAFTVRDLFRHQTIAALAGQLADSPQGAATGHSSPLTSAQAYLLGGAIHAPDLVQSRLFTLPRALAPVAVQQLAAALWRRHDALRGTLDASGLRFPAAGAPPQALVHQAAPESGLAADALVYAHAAVIAASGPLFLLSQPAGVPALVMSLHRVVCDARSWTVLEADIGRLLDQLTDRLPLDLGRGPAYAGWLCSTTAATPPLAHGPAANSAAHRTEDTASGSVVFNPVLANGAFRTRTMELLLAAFLLMRAEDGATGPADMVVGGDARDAEGGIDYGATVGCFLALRRLSLPHRPEADIVQALEAAKRHYRAIPAPPAGAGPSGPVVRFTLDEAPAPHSATGLLAGETLAIEHTLHGQCLHVAIYSTGSRATRLLSHYCGAIGRIEALCMEELKLIATREQYAHMISHNEADLDLYGEEF
ncbi:hypothetical protein ASF04_26245 [Duganella sp. Leaf61]|uniref:phosphopantetheine-binding protein n=1 Tax=Duganella sp. Leaf61 TaxID=1736227 RepID=UPI0006F5C51B|nr:phosphopantetheine-binding protein [Duganella sp. Leaf61]KQN74466.1 hypothetical protein ASF04_26245 [Duganella sp. Leaf61]